MNAQDRTWKAILWRNRPRILAAALIAVTILYCAAQSRAAGLLIADGGFGGVLEIEEHEVNVVINNGVAVTEVTQVFRNTENRQVEALYTFPVPKAASVSNFSMWIDGKEMVGEVLEKERAREIYNSYKQQRRDPGLLEQVDYRTFEMHIFPIGPGAAQKVQIAYYQELDVDNDWATYVYPLATATRAGIDARAKKKFAFSLDVKSEIPIVEMSSPSHGAALVVATHNEGYRQASLETAGGNLNKDLVVSYKLSRPKTGLDLIASRTRGEDGYFMLTLTAGEELKALKAGMDYVFILDMSGSMDDEGKLWVSQESITAFINQLALEDNFETIAFNVQPSPLFSALRPAEEQNKSAAKKFLASLQPKGGTVLAPAINMAYKYKNADRPLNVVILSDGMTELGERQELLSLIQARPGGTRVFCIGVGNEVNRPLLEQLAEDAGGLAAFVSRGDDFDRQAKAFQRKLVHPVASNLRFGFSGVEVYDVEGPFPPSLFHGAPARLYGRYRGNGPVQVKMTADIGGQRLDNSVEMVLPQADDSSPEIERMWAWHRVQRLLKEADRGGSRDSVIDEIVRLGEGYSIATEYTSFLVLENDAEYGRWKIERRNAARIERDRKKQKALREELKMMRDRSAAQVGPAQEALKTPPQEVAAAQKPPTPGVQSAGQNPPPQPRDPGTNVDLSLPGGGAFDPITGGIALGLAGAAALSRRRKKR